MSAQIFRLPHAIDAQVFAAITNLLETQGEYLFVNGAAVFHLKGIQLSDAVSGTMLTGLMKAAPKNARLHLSHGRPGHGDDYVIITTTPSDASAWKENPQHSHVQLGIVGNGVVDELDEEPRIPFEKVDGLPPDHRAARRHAFAVECTR